MTSWIKKLFGFYVCHICAEWTHPWRGHKCELGIYYDGPFNRFGEWVKK